MTEPSKHGIETAERIKPVLHQMDTGNDLANMIQQAIDAATAELREEIVHLKDQLAVLGTCPECFDYINMKDDVPCSNCGNQYRVKRFETQAVMDSLKRRYTNAEKEEQP